MTKKLLLEMISKVFFELPFKITSYTIINQKNRSPNEIFFTLTDLVVVTLVSCIIMTLSFATIANVAKESATTALCRNNLKILNNGLNSYLADNNDYYPTSNPPSHQALWAPKIAPYVNVEAKADAKATPFICPDDAANANLTYADLEQHKSSYGINGYGVCWNHATSKGIKKQEILNPDMIILIDAPAYLAVAYTGEGIARVPVPRHEAGKAINILFADGRVETVGVNVSKPGDIFSDDNLPAEYWRRTN